MMVLLLGLILAVFTIICAVWAYWDVSGKGRMPLMPIIVFVAGMLLYTQIQPSYLPKGTVPRSTVPEFKSKSWRFGIAPASQCQVRSVIAFGMSATEKA